MTEKLQSRKTYNNCRTKCLQYQGCGIEFQRDECRVDECPPVFATMGDLIANNDDRINICKNETLQAECRRFFKAEENPDVWSS